MISGGQRSNAGFTIVVVYWTLKNTRSTRVVVKNII